MSRVQLPSFSQRLLIWWDENGRKDLPWQNPRTPYRVWISEIMLVVDAGTGQNALNQAREFNQAIGLTGITVTKLDGTARGGVLFGIAHELGLPIRFIGVGEAAKDLRPFDAGSFVNAILPID